MIDIVNPFDTRLLQASCSLGTGRESLFPEPPLWQSHRPEGAFELKFLVDDQKAQAVRDWARQRLQPDPNAAASQTAGIHGAANHGDCYRVHSLYLDTPRLDIFHRLPAMEGTKYRLRRYGDEGIVWLERKQKTDGIVRKQRVASADEEFVRRLQGPVGDSWEGNWFRDQVDGLGLRPTCHVTYQRFARVGMTPAGPVRLTLDSGLCGERTADWSVPKSLLGTNSLLSGRSILELKFRDVVPSLFKELMQTLQLSTGRFSKYRETVRRFTDGSSAGNTAPATEQDDA